MGSAFSFDKNNVSSGSSTDSVSSSQVCMGWGAYVFHAVFSLIIVVWAVYFSWQWNSYAGNSTAAKVLYAWGAGIVAPIYLLYSLIARRDGINIRCPDSGSTMTQMSTQRQQKMQKSQQKVQAKLE